MAAKQRNERISGNNKIMVQGVMSQPEENSQPALYREEDSNEGMRGKVS